MTSTKPLRGPKVGKVKSKKPTKPETVTKAPVDGLSLGYKPDREWFAAQSKAAGISQRSLAKVVGLDPSAMNRSLRGVRKFQIHEAAIMARTLGVPVAEVVLRIGFSDKRQAVPIVGRISGDNTVEIAKGLGEAIPPTDVTLETKAYIFETLSSPISHYDGYIAYVEPHTAITGDTIGRPAIISCPERNSPLFGAIVRVSRKGTYRIALFGEGVTFETNSITSVELITWMRAP